MLKQRYLTPSPELLEGWPPAPPNASFTFGPVIDRDYGIPDLYSWPVLTTATVHPAP
jgi:hypothetical protein